MGEINYELCEVSDMKGEKHMKNIFIKYITLVIATVLLASNLSICTFAATVVDTTTAPGWSINSVSNDSKGVLDTTIKHSGAASLRLTNNTPNEANKYLLVETNIAVVPGKTYHYGLSAKSERGSMISLMIDWKNRVSLLPLGGNFDWMNFDFEYTHTKETQTINLAFLFDNTVKNFWMDDVYFCEYDGKENKENLIANPSFEGVVKKTNSANIKTLDSKTTVLYENLKTETSFSVDDLQKVMGGFSYQPVFYAKNLTIDGNLNDWAGIPSINLPVKSSQYMIFNNGNIDLKASYKSAYDANNLYLAFETEDDVFFSKDSASYWGADSVQVALSQAGESYGIELGFVHNNETGGSGVYSSSLTSSQLENVALKSTHNGSKTVYEVAIPWNIKYNGVPKNFLFNCLFNDNDNDSNGRKYCLEYAPGISTSKDNAYFAYMETLEEDQDWYAWFEGNREVHVGNNDTYSLYLVNNGETRNFDIIVNDKETKVTVEKGKAIRSTFEFSFAEVGTKTLKALITDSKKERTITADIVVKPSAATYSDFFDESKGYLTELSELMKKCNDKNIATDYEQANYSIIERFIQYMQNDIKQDDFSRMDYTITCLNNLYQESKENLEGYLNGTKEIRPVPRYLTSKMDIKGQSLYADTVFNGVKEKRPVFFTGYGHFDQARNDVPNFEKFGINAIQTEIGPDGVLAKEGNVNGWMTGMSGKIDAELSVAEDTENKNNHLLKIANRTPSSPNVYCYMIQTVAVKPNTTYEFGFKAKGNSVNNVWMSMNSYSNRKYINGTFDWKDYTFEYTTGENAGVQEVLFVCEDKTAELLVDNMFVREIKSNGNLLNNGDFEKLDPNKFGYIINPVSVQNIITTLKNAEKGNVAVSLNIAPHYFPNFILQQFPELKVNTSAFIKYNVLHPVAKQVIEEYLRTLIPLVKDYKSLNNICISNEPVFQTSNDSCSEFYQPFWVDYLKELYENDISKLNQTYGTEYMDFEDVKQPKAFEATPQFYDYMGFNNEIFAQWHEFIADTIHEIAQGIPVESKMMMYTATYDTNQFKQYMNFGTDHELFAEFSDLNGDDAWQYINFPNRGLLEKTLWYDFQTSIKNVAIANTEDHIIEDRYNKFVPEIAKHVGTDLWQGAIHGRGISTIWSWQRTYNKNSDHWSGFLFRPDCIAAVSKSNLDMNRLSYEITALQQEKADVAILYSNSSRVYSEEYMNCLYNAYQGLVFNGKKVNFLTEKQIDRLNDYKLLILPEAKNVDGHTLDVIEQYIQNGGKVLMFGEECLARDEHNLSFDENRLAEIRTQSTVIQTNHDEYRMLTPDADQTFDIIGEELKKLNMTDIVLIDEDTGNPVRNTEYESAVYNGKVIVNINNYEWKSTKKVRIEVNGKPVSDMKELINLQNLKEEFAIEPFTPLLVCFDVENYFFDTYGIWAESNIADMAQKGLVKGVSPSRFEPQRYITRAEFISLLARAAGVKEAPYINCFNDVAENDWFADSVQAAANAGWLFNFVENGNLNPNSPITREEIAILLVKALNKDIPDAKLDFKDINQLTSETVSYVQKAVALSLLQGDTDGYFRPNDNATRAEAVTVIKRLIDLGVDKNEIK